MTTTEPSAAALAAEITEPTMAELRSLFADLREEFAVLRASLTTEVRTRRLVVVDDHGSERITTTCSDQASRITVQVAEDHRPDDDLTHIGVFISAELDREGPNGEHYAIAEVDLITGDDSCATLEQRRALDNGWMVENGRLRLHQQPSYRDGPSDLTTIEVGANGVTELSGAAQRMSAFAPMQRVAVRS